MRYKNEYKVNYVGITRCIIASVIDYVIKLGILPILYFVLLATYAIAFNKNELGKSYIGVDFDFLSNELLAAFIISIFFTILETLMITRLAVLQDSCYVVFI